MIKAILFSLTILTLTPAFADTYCGLVLDQGDSKIIVLASGSNSTDAYILQDQNYGALVAQISEGRACVKAVQTADVSKGSVLTIESFEQLSF